MEIKKAFEQMKKDIKKELGIVGGFSMTVKQIKNRTATYCVCNDISFDDEIKRLIKENEKVQGFDAWTAEEKERCANKTEELIKIQKSLKEQYGTKDNQAKMILEQISNSKAFKKFSNEVGNAVCFIDKVDWIYYIRFNY